MIKLVKRSIKTRSQTELKGEQRRRNVKDAFVLSGKVNRKTCVVFDNVFTTGSTVSEVAAILKGTGVNNILALTIVC